LKASAGGILPPASRHKLTLALSPKEDVGDGPDWPAIGLEIVRQPPAEKRSHSTCVSL